MSTETDSDRADPRQSDTAVSVDLETSPRSVGLLALDADRVVVDEIIAFLADGDVELLSTRVGMPGSFTLDGFLGMGEAMCG